MNTEIDNIYRPDGKIQIGKAIPFGLQHILAMFVANIAPIVMGISFTFVSVFCYIGPTYGYNAIVGAVLVGGLAEGILGLLACLLFHIFAKNSWKQLSGLQDTAVVALPSLLPFKPEFNINAILAVVLNLALPKNMETASHS